MFTFKPGPVFSRHTEIVMKRNFLASSFMLLTLTLFGVSPAFSQVGAASSTLPPEPAPPGAAAAGIQDPYMSPGTTSRPLLENPPSNPFSAFTGGAGGTAGTSERGTRLFQNFGTDFTWITSGAGVHNMGLFRMDFAGDIAMPVFSAQENPFLIEPRFAINYWNGPQSDVYDMSAHTFDASLGLRWLPQLQMSSMATALKFDLFFNVGLYSDFKSVTSKSFRFPSWGYLSFELTKTLEVKAGVWYLDRVRYKIFPSGGVIWRPNEQWEFDILFPNPRVTYRPAGASLHNVSLYTRGEYGGGSWTVDHEFGGTVKTDYNDYRIMFGLDWHGRGGSVGYFELGVAFARELYFDDPRGAYDLDAGFLMQAGFHF